MLWDTPACVHAYARLCMLVHAYARLCTPVHACARLCTLVHAPRVLAAGYRKTQPPCACVHMCARSRCGVGKASPHCTRLATVGPLSAVGGAPCVLLLGTADQRGGSGDDPCNRPCPYDATYGIGGYGQGSVCSTRLAEVGDPFAPAALVSPGARVEGLGGRMPLRNVNCWYKLRIVMPGFPCI